MVHIHVSTWNSKTTSFHNPNRRRLCQPPKKKTYHPKDRWTLKTGYFEDSTPAIQVRSPFHWRVLWILKVPKNIPEIPGTRNCDWVPGACGGTAVLYHDQLLMRVSGWIYTTVSVPHVPIEQRKTCVLLFWKNDHAILGQHLAWWQDVKCLDFNPQSQWKDRCTCIETLLEIDMHR